MVKNKLKPNITTLKISKVTTVALLSLVLLSGGLMIPHSHALSAISIYPDFNTSPSSSTACSDYIDYNGYPSGALATTVPDYIGYGPLDQEYSSGYGASFCSYISSSSFTPTSAVATLYLVESSPETEWNVSVLLVDLSSCPEFVSSNDCTVVAQGSLNELTNVPYSDQEGACLSAQPFQVNLAVTGSLVSEHELGVQINASEVTFLADELLLCTGPMGDGSSSTVITLSSSVPTAQKIPFAGSFMGLQEPDPSFSCPPQCIQVNPFASVGTFSYVGGATFSGTMISDWSKFGSLQICASVTLNGVITASDGSNLAVSGAGVQCKILSGHTYTGTNSLIVGLKIFDGTGQFLGDSGYGLAAEKVTANSGVFSGNILGVISIPSNS